MHKARIHFICLQAYERRFPTCPQIPVFIGCEIMSDEESEDGAIRTTERRCKLNVDAPYILKKVCPYVGDLIFIMTFSIIVIVKICCFYYYYYY